MAIEQHIVELINAEIDGEISAAERDELEAHLRSDAEAKALYDELAGLCRTLDGMQEMAPPPHMRHIILDAAKDSPQPQPAEPFWKGLLVAPPLHYASMFAAGSLVTFLIVSSNRISEGAFDEVTDLVGTISSDVGSAENSAAGTIQLSDQTLAGTVRGHRNGQLMVIDFDLTSTRPVEIIARFADRDVWFNGFAQLESDGLTISAQTGQVTLRMAGKRRYAVYLHNASDSAATVSLQFIAAGNLIYEDNLNFGSAD